MANFTLGVDLGQARDFTALVVVERIEVFTGMTRPYFDGGHTPVHDDHHHVRHVERLPLGTSYPSIVEICAGLVETPELAGQTEIVLDATGVGRAVVELFVQAYRNGRLGTRWPVAITITSGQQANGLRVPKRELVSKLQALLQTNRLKVSDQGPFVDALRSELTNFRAKISASGHDTYEAWRERDHDDLVLALALACWYRHQSSEPRYLTRRGELIEKAWART